MSTLSKTEIEYPEALAALGHFIVKEGMSDVCVMEFEGGVIVTGSKLLTVGEHLNRHTATHVLSNDDVRRLVKEH